MKNVGATQADQSEKQINVDGQIQVANPPFRMVSIDRFSKLPVVEEIVKLTTHLYGKLRRANCVFNWSVKKAESTASKFANVTAPVVIKLQSPIEKLDGLLCVGLDYVESKVPSVKLPPNEMYVNTKQRVIKSIQPCMNCASAVKNYGANKLMEVCRACGVCEPGAFDVPDREEKNSKLQGDGAQSLDSPAGPAVTLELETKFGTSPGSKKFLRTLPN